MNHMIPINNSILVRKGNTLTYPNILDSKTYTADIINAQTGEILYYWSIQEKNIGNAMSQLMRDIHKQSVTTDINLIWRNFKESKDKQ